MIQYLPAEQSQFNTRGVTSRLKIPSVVQLPPFSQAQSCNRGTKVEVAFPSLATNIKEASLSTSLKVPENVNTPSPCRVPVCARLPSAVSVKLLLSSATLSSKENGSPIVMKNT